MKKVVRLDLLLNALGGVAAREQARAITEFEAEHGPYDGGSDEHWDLLNKDYCAVESAMDLIRETCTEYMEKPV